MDVISIFVRKIDMKIKPAVLICIIFGYISCQKDNDFDKSLSNENLIGYWVNPSYPDSFLVLTKELKLKDNEYGIAFLNDGSLVERKNSGWCGTPPITYGDFNGIWNTKDSMVYINVDYWGGKANYKWKIISLTNNRLKVLVKEQ
jgi:hypothetical protein